MSSMVIAPANTGRDKRSRIAVKITDQGNRVILSDSCFFGRILIKVAIKLVAPRIDLIPAAWREKMVMSTGGPL